MSFASFEIKKQHLLSCSLNTVKKNRVRKIRRRKFLYSLLNLKARFYYERGKEHSLFVLLIFFALASILTARFNRRSIKETKNVLFHTHSGNGP